MTPASLDCDFQELIQADPFHHEEQTCIVMSATQSRYFPVLIIWALERARPRVLLQALGKLKPATPVHLNIQVHIGIEEIHIQVW